MPVEPEGGRPGREDLPGRLGTALILLRIRRLGVRVPLAPPGGYRQNCRCHTDRTVAVACFKCGAGGLTLALVTM